MKKYYTAKELVSIFKKRLNFNKIAANDVHALLAKYKVPKKTGPYGTIYEYDKVDEVLSEMYWYLKNGKLTLPLIRTTTKAQTDNQIKPIDYSNNIYMPGADMGKASQELLSNDEVWYESKKTKKRKIIISENQLEFIKNKKR
jgi:hypothetical protein